MKVRCPHCGSTGNVDKDFAGRKAQCPKCNEKFVLEPATEKSLQWYYAVDRERKGPFSRDEFFRMMEDGAVTDDMLVWNRTMKNWQRLADVKLDGGGTEQRPCGECGEHFAENRLLQHGDELVCDSCKLKLLKEKREGEDEEVFENIDLNYAGIFSRFVAKIVDFIIMFLIAFGTEFSARIVFSEYFATATLSSAFMVTLFINMVLGILYITWFVGRFGATPGKMLFHMKIVNGDGSRIGYGQAFARYCGEFVVASLTFSIGYLMAAVDSEHRALHDRICNTRVVAA